MLRKRVVAASVALSVGLINFLISPAQAAANASDIIGGLDAPIGTVTAVTQNADPAGIDVGSAAIAGFPTKVSNYLVLSTGVAGDLPGSASTNASTDLAAAPASADGNDLTQVTLHLSPPAGSTCVAFDFAFLSEEYPEFVGSSYNDIFTAELNQSQFTVSAGQVVAPNNFAYDSEGNPVSVNTVFGMAPVAGTVMDGSTPVLNATSPVERKADGTMDLILSVQDLGDSIYDSAVLVDNLRFGNGPACTAGATELTDTDGDALPDDWEINGVDTNSDGSIDLDLPAMGASPNHKDLFIEADYMRKAPSCIWFICWGGRNFAPDQSALADVRSAFAAAPVDNPDGSTGVRAHIDSGPSSVMNPSNGAVWGSRSRSNQVPWVKSLGITSASGDYDWSAFSALKSAHFNLPRYDVFHYALFADTYAGSDSSGISRGIPAGDMLVTDGGAGWGGGFTRTQERGTFMHELGHGLGLRHGGDVDTNYRPDYLSIMNYAFQMPGLPPNSRLDYSRGAPFIDWKNIRFDGGAIGARGDTVTLPDTTIQDEATPQQLKDSDAYAVDGDGLLTFVGPSVLFAGAENSLLNFDVTNLGSVEDTFTLAVTSDPSNVAGTQNITIPAGATQRVTMHVNTTALTAGTFQVIGTLSSTLAGNSLSEAAGEVTVPNMSDPSVRADAQAALDQLGKLPTDSGIDPAVSGQVIQSLTETLNAGSPTSGPSRWSAKIRIRGDHTTTFTTALAKAYLSPSLTQPKRIRLASEAGQRLLRLQVTRARVSAPLRGRMRFAVGTSKTVRVKLLTRWKSGKLVLSGSWHEVGHRRVNGTLQITTSKTRTR